MKMYTIITILKQICLLEIIIIRNTLTFYSKQPAVYWKKKLVGFAFFVFIYLKV